MVVDRLQVLKPRQAQRPDARRAAPRPRPNPTRDERQGRRGLLGRHAAELDAEARQKRPRACELGPELATLPGLQEECRACDARQTRRTAIRALEAWIAQVQPTGHKALLQCVATGRRGEPELLTAVDERITNAFVDGTHNKLKLSTRRAFGCRTVETLRDRILHECGGL
jgi:transposase